MAGDLMASHVYRHQWDCPPRWSMWRLIATATPILADALAGLHVERAGPVEWTRPQPDLLFAHVPVDGRAA